MRHTLLWASNQLKNYKCIFSFNVLLGFILTAINLVVVYYTQTSISSVTTERSVFIQNVFLLIFFIALQILLGSLQGYIGGRLSAKISYDYKNKFNNKILNLSKSSKDKLNSGDIISIFNHDVNTLVGFVPGGLYIIIFQIVMAIIAAIYLVFINWVLLLASISFLPIAMFVLNVLQKKMRTYFTKDSESRGKANIIATEVSKNIYTVKSYNMQDLMCNKIKVFFKDSLNSWISIHKIFSPILMLTIMLRNLPKFICICLGGWLALNGQLKLEELIGFLMLLGYIISPILAIPDIIVTVTSTGTSLERVNSVMDLPNERTNGNEINNSKKDHILLEARDVSFGYVEDKIILYDINFKLRKGEQIALVGKSGCGKSSIINLIIGDYEVDSGSMFIYGQPYDVLSLKSIRNEIALVSQDITIFPFSISENIAIGSSDPDVSKEKIEEAAKLSNAHQFIMNLPEQYDSILDENGVNLSGGEKQMISIARAFLKNAPIILLDEPTSALDAQSEKMVNESLKKLMQNKGVIIVSHRLSTIIQSDKILVIKDGCVIDEGPHSELLERNEYYRNLYLYDFKTDSNGGNQF